MAMLAVLWLPLAMLGFAAGVMIAASFSCMTRRLRTSSTFGRRLS